ncbi:transporter substrate-binding domain-containing protein [Oceanobacillus sp. Castelsardo]|uniref:transporter substrate-binding domain-containing protein n=1 Tax=Oceanobacillus sp. Castelsardo TaxID=1851204 RepID=UPI000839A725|nr:transporter substrate-binding domain-containing protein [Oceanobacillus sp. Castelsardo]
MKKLTILISTILVFFLVGCASSGGAQSSGEKVIKIGAGPDGYPQYFKEDGELKGFSVDVITAIFDHIGYEIEWVLTDWNGILANLESGKVETVANFAATEERGQKYHFTDPYYSSKTVIATGKENNSIQSLDDLNGKQVANVLGSNYENVLKETYPDDHYEIVTYESNDVIFTEVANGKIDAFVSGREILLAQINEKGIPLEVVGEPFGDQPVALPFKKTEENDAFILEINQALEELKEDGTISELSEKWYGMDLLEK